MFDDLDLEDDYDQESQLKGEDLAFEQGSDSGEGDDFNANELLNFQDYQNKRKQSPFGQKKTTAEPLSIKDVFDDKKRQQMNESESEEEDDWGTTP